MTDLQDKRELLKLNIEMLDKQIENTEVKSNISGKVLSVSISKGDVLSAGMKVMTIANTSDMEVIGLASETDTKLIREGMSVNIVLKSDGKSYKGKVTKKGNSYVKADSTSLIDKTSAIYVEPVNEISELPGASADLEIILNSKKNVLTIPIDCIVDSSFVYVVDESGVVNKREVKLGLTNEYQAEILEGIVEGETVITNPDDSLNDGVRVQITDD